MQSNNDNNEYKICIECKSFDLPQEGITSLTKVIHCYCNICVCTPIRLITKCSRCNAINIDKVPTQWHFSIYRYVERTTYTLCVHCYNREDQLDQAFLKGCQTSLEKTLLYNNIDPNTYLPILANTFQRNEC